MDYVQLVENLRKELLVLYSKLIPYSSGTNISDLLEKIDCKLFQLGKSLYGNMVFMLNNPISAVEIIDLLNYKRILTFRQVNPEYCSNLNMLTGEMIGDIIQWNQGNLLYGITNQAFWFNKIIKNGISADSYFPDVLLPQYIITTISVYNTTTNAFQLVVQLTDGTELLNEYIEDSGFLTLTLDTPIKLLTGVSVSSANWNSAVINLSISTENPFYEMKNNPATFSKITCPLIEVNNAAIPAPSTEFIYANANHLYWGTARLDNEITSMGTTSKSSAVDAGTFGDISLTDDYIYICVLTGVAGAAKWKKALLFESL